MRVVAVAFAAVPARVKELVRRLGRTTLGKNLDPRLGAARPGRRCASANVEQWPDRVRGFEDLAFMFSSNQLNHGVASLQIDEAALLYRLARDAPSGPFAEIGRFKGGSTIVFAISAARGRRAAGRTTCTSRCGRTCPGEQLDAELQRRARALRARAQGAPPRRRLAHGRAAREPLELLFIDGDHTYEGAKADFERWSAFVRPDGHLLFHDAVDAGGYGNVYPGVARLRRRDRAGAGWERSAGAGSIAHFLARMMHLVAVVLNWNGGDDTLAALESLEGIETICVDNGSTDGSDASSRSASPSVELIRTGANLGFAGGNNVGHPAGARARRRLACCC